MFFAFLLLYIILPYKSLATENYEIETVSDVTTYAGNGLISSQTCTGENFLANADSAGNITLLGDVTVTTPIVISQGKTITLDLNGYVLKSAAMEKINAKTSASGYSGYDETIKNDLCRVLVVYGNLIINDSNPTKENKGSLVQVSRWIDKRLDNSKLTPEGEIYSTSVKYKDRYYWSKTEAGKDNDETAEDAKRFWIYDKTGSAVIKGGIITGGVNTTGGGIYVGGGNLTINAGTIAGNKSIRYITTDADGYQTAAAGNGGGIYSVAYGTLGNSNYKTSTITMNGGAIIYNWTDSLGGGVALNSATEFYMNSGSLSNNVAQSSGGGITVRGESSFFIGVDVNNVYTKKSAPIISGNKTYSTRYTGGGGGIEVDGGSLNYTVGKIENNFASGSGGGIYCYRGGSVSASTVNTVISGNYANGSGGGIYLQYGDVTLDECILENNKARASGGAVGIRVGNFYMTGGTIWNNKAGNHGGAVYVTAQNNITPHYDIGSLGCNVSLKGTTVDNNIANDHGGAFYVSVMNSTENVNVDIISSTIINNKAGNESDTDEGYGGAIYLSGGTLTIKEEEKYGNTKIYGNTADGGGAFYVADRVRKSTDNPPPYSVDQSKLTTETLDESGKYYSSLNDSQVIKYSDTKEGIVIIESGEIYNNHAQKSNGGAFLVSGTASFVDIKGGDLSNNSAEGYGGTICISGGNLNIDGGIISNSKATSGGGVYINNGNITMNGGVISNNQAEYYGGGIYAASDSKDLNVTISSGSIIGNVAGKNGGGVGVNMGSGLAATVTIGLKDCKGLDEAHSHPIIQDNTANENGGGFWLDGDNMTMDMYCGVVNENLAILEPGSANIYQTGGNATVYAGEVGEGVIVIGGEYVYIPDKQEKEITIIYDSNNPDNPEQKHALVTVGIDIYLPKNLFTREGYVLVGWSHIPNPTANDKIYSVGEPYLVDEEDITVYAIWLLEGSGTVEVPGIKVGKLYDKVDNGTNIITSSNASFTTQMSVLQIQPNYYTNRTLEFDKNLPNGTNITMVDLSNENQKQFYHYKVESREIKNIKLSEFTKNGSLEKFVDSKSSELVDEKFLFIVELPIDNEETGARQISLIRNSADSQIAAIEQTTSYTMAEKRTFELNYSDETGIFEDATVESTMNISYSSEASKGDDTRFKNKKVALKISSMPGNSIPKDVKIFDGTNYYNQNGKGEFIIPFGNIDDSRKINLNLISEILKQNEFKVSLKAEILACDDMNNPCMGEVVAKKENILLNAIKLPAIRIDMNQHAYAQEEFSRNLKLEYKTAEIDVCSVTLEIQKKVSSNSYVTQTGLLTLVDGNSENTDGVFDLDLNSSGTIDLEFAENLNNQDGTYRILIKLKNNENIIYEIPVNFIITK